MIKVLLKQKILSLEAILGAYKHTHTHTHTGTHPHKHSDYTKLIICSLKQAANAQETWNERHYHRTENVSGLKFWEKICF